MSRFCESCGSPIDEDSAFCEVCGARVDADDEALAAAVEPVELPPVEPEVTAVQEVAPEAPPVPIVEIPDLAPPVQQPEPDPEAATVPSSYMEPEPIVEVLETPAQVEPVTPPIQAQTAIVEPSPSVAHSQSDKSQSPSSLPKVAVAVVAVLVVAGGVFGGMKLVKGGTASEPAKPADPPVKPASPDQTPAPASTVDVTELRTEVTKVLSDVSAAGWSDAVCSISLPRLKSLAAKAKEGGREDLADYWTSLSSYIQACNAANKQDRASSKRHFTSAVAALSNIPVDEIVKDTVLKGDVIGSIGSYMSIANDMGLPSSYPSCQILVQLKNKLEKQ